MSRGYCRIRHQISIHAQTLIAKSSTRMNKFVMEVSSLVEEECRMLHRDMDISILMVFAQQIEEIKLRKMNRDGKRARSIEQSQPKSKRGFKIKIPPW